MSDNRIDRGLTSIPFVAYVTRTKVKINIRNNNFFKLDY